MPELPEVETVMRGLRARLEGRRLARAELRRGDLRWAAPEGLAARLTGRRVLGFRRRAKYILMRLEGGESVLLHLGMSGRMAVTEGDAAARALPGAHEHLVLETEDGARVGFVDPRRFGSVHLVATPEEDQHRLLAGLGPEPLEPGFTGALLAERLRGRNTPLKAALLDQRVVAGLGNIYVCEALFRAGLSPRRRGGQRRRRTRRAARPGDQGDARGRHRRRRVELARLRAAERRAWLIPARLEGVWPRGAAVRTLLRGAPLSRHKPPCAGWTQHVLLSANTAIENAMPEMILIETHGRVGLIRLNRPQALNALCDQLMQELGDQLLAFDRDPAIGCIVVTGSEKAFAAGADIKEMRGRTYPAAFHDDFIAARWETVLRVRKPVIAAVAGFALGGGCELAMMCDLILAADSARFGQPEINLGVIPGAGGTQRLTRAVGKSKAMEMCLTGRMMDAAEAERSNLVCRVVPAADLIAEALKLGREHRGEECYGRRHGEARGERPPTRRGLPRACGRNAPCSSPCSEPRTSRRAWRRSSRSGSRVSSGADLDSGRHESLDRCLS